MTPSPQFDVAVIGGGLAGLSAALVAAEAGARVALVAPATAPRDQRTTALLGGSVALLDRLGVWPKVAGDAAPLRTMRIVDATRRLFRAPPVEFHAAEIEQPAFGWNVPNAALLGALEARLAAAPVTRVPALARSIAIEPGHVAVSAEGGTTLTARLVAAADGRRSPAREAAGIGTIGWSYPQAALVLNLSHTRPHDEVSTEFHTEHGPFTLVPLPGLRSSLVWVDRPAESERRKRLSDAALAAEIEAQSHSILGAITVDGPRQTFPLSGLTARRFGARRVVLVGEAAHVFPPIGAQGLNLGLRDAEAVGRLLARFGEDPGSAAATAEYDRARRADVLGRTLAVDALDRTLLSGLLPVQVLRGAGLFLLDRIAPLRRAVMRSGLSAA
ncbi:UbiH/UbiF family hydroxylase [Prosthecomicrobium pneumaticum]|uniref:2-octaprenyl-6-methoxyphenol hydroxylase n=1 Tax=Prosthecomicrobium pneumaticum TaxID=81895 RepID=A0A7W9FIW9_9HYPH|nr:UbiH/UbiF family hydroxylase [Prosthecomicrobium pneumaticum]MBB5751122.1 2-octaprenyl-6-methoxyphenol hydroxylase [Prosthecomicrobium pneumaticum]